MVASIITELLIAGSRAQAGDEDALAIGRELQTIGAFHGDGQSLNSLFRGDVNDGNGGVARVRCPDFFSVGRDVEAFNALAGWDVRDFPGETRFALLVRPVLAALGQRAVLIRLARPVADQSLRRGKRLVQ